MRYRISSIRFVRLLTVLVILSAAIGLQGVRAQAPDFSGYVFSDYYYLVDSHIDDLDGQNGVWFRRIYLTMDQTVNDRWSMRLRTEMAQPGDFETKATMDPFVKDAYLTWKNDRQQVYIGLASSPTWALEEKIWGYRSVEKTALDLYKYGSSRDIGVAVKGKFAADNRGAYHVMLGNGASNKSETNAGKKAMGSLQYSLADGLTVEGYVDFERVSETTDRYLLRAAAYYQADAGRFGASFTSRTTQVDELDDVTDEVFSIFAAHEVNERAVAFGRFDYQFQPNGQAEKISYFPFAVADETIFVIAGLDYTVAKNVHFIPNLEFGSYSMDDGDAPDADIMARFTVYYKF